MKWVVSLFLCTSCVFGAEHHVDLSPALSFHDFGPMGSMEVDYRILYPFEDGFIILNPRARASFYGHAGHSLGIGVRQDLPGFMFGSFVFAHYSYYKNTHSVQVGPTFEFIGSRWGTRMNIYLPVKGDSLYETHTRVEWEGHYKCPMISIGVIPIYDASLKKVGVLGRISKKTPFGEISFTAGLDPLHGKMAKMSFSILRFSKLDGYPFSPIWHYKDFHSMPDRHRSPVDLCEEVYELIPDTQQESSTHRRR